MCLDIIKHNLFWDYFFISRGKKRRRTRRFGVPIAIGILTKNDEKRGQNKYDLMMSKHILIKIKTNW